MGTAGDAGSVVVPGVTAVASEPKQRRSAPKAQKAGTKAAPARQGSVLLVDWIVHGWRLITALAAIAIVVVAWMQWRTLDSIDRALNATERPWVSASVEPVQLVFDDNGGGITLSMTIKNGGPVPAVNVLAAPMLLLGDTKQPYRNACRRYGTAGGIGPMLFKDDSVAKTSTAWLSRVDFDKNFPSLVAVCIRYRFANSSRTGETGYLFLIARHNPPGPDVNFVEAKNGTFTPPELALLPIGSYHN